MLTQANLVYNQANISRICSRELAQFGRTSPVFHIIISNTLPKSPKKSNTLPKKKELLVFFKFKKTISNKHPHPLMYISRGSWTCRKCWWHFFFYV